MTPKQLVELWVERFNAADVEGLGELYSADAVNHQVVLDEPLRGRDAIEELFKIEFGRAKMTCIPENLVASDEWVALEWRDLNGLRGCGFFQVKNDKIVFQRGYFDQLTFFKLNGLPVPDTYLGE